MYQGSAAERRNALEGAIIDCRLDGRQRLDIRPVTVRLNTSSYSIGSASASLSSSAEGTTVAVAAVSCDVSLAPEEGRGRMLFHVDVSTTSNGVAAKDNTGTSKRHETEAALVRLLEKAYGVDPADAVPVEDASAAPRWLAKATAPTRAVDRLKAAATRTQQRILAELGLGHGHCFDLHVDVQVLSVTAGNVAGVVAAAVRAALIATVLPSATISLGADGSITAVHIDAKKPSKALATVVERTAPIVLELAADPVTGVYVADPSPLEEATFPVLAHVAIAPGENDHHHCVRFCALKSARRAASDDESIANSDRMGVGLSAVDLTALLSEASGALADFALGSLRAVDEEQR